MKNCGIKGFNTIEEVQCYLEAHWASDWSDYKGGSLRGLAAARYLLKLPGGERALDFPLFRGSPDALVFSAECDWNEEEEIIRRLKPVDFARDGNTLVVIVYREDKGYSDVFRNERVKNHKKRTAEAEAKAEE